MDAEADLHVLRVGADLVTPGTDDMGRPVGATTDVDYVWRIE
jgi:hypothetical protein